MHSVLIDQGEEMSCDNTDADLPGENSSYMSNTSLMMKMMTCPTDIVI